VPTVPIIQPIGIFDRNKNLQFVYLLPFQLGLGKKGNPAGLAKIVVFFRINLSIMDSQIPTYRVILWKIHRFEVVWGKFQSNTIDRVTYRSIDYDVKC
jgi:hypothetical protein